MRLTAPIALALVSGLVSALAFTAPARAVELPADVDKALWCGHAFTIVSGEIKSDDAEMSAKLAEQGAALIASARASMGEAGTAEDAIEATSQSYAQTVAAEIEGKAENAKYSYDDCLTLVE